MRKRKLIQLSVSFPEVVYDDLKKLSVRRKASMATVVRSFVEQGLKIESYDENTEELRRMINDELTAVFRKESERLIKLQVKGTKASAITMYTGLQIISESYADEASFTRLVASAGKQAAVYMKQKEKSDEENMQEAKQLIADMKKVVRAREE